MRYKITAILMEVRNGMIAPNQGTKRIMDLFAPPPRTYEQGAKECEWEKEDEDSRGEFWRPSCDPPIYYFNGPIEFYQFKICPYCGKPLRALPTQPEGEGE